MSMTTNSSRVSPLLGSIAQSSSARGKTNGAANDQNPKDTAVKARFKLQRKAQRLLPDERIALCMRKLTPAANFVTGWHNPKNGAAGFGNLITCDSYSCPVCAPRRAEQDRRELSVALAQAKKLGFFPVMVTYTMSHYRGNALGVTREGINTAYKQALRGRWYKDLREDWQIIGGIKAWEVTYGANGWHPHIHTLLFLKVELTPAQIQHFEALLSERFREVLAENGLYADELHGVNVRTAESDIADYIAKFGREPVSKAWGADQEIARASSKKASLDGLTPFQILNAADGSREELERLAVVSHCATVEDAKPIAEKLYTEYFYAFKGVARLYWTPGLAELLGVEEALSEMVANEHDPHEADETLVMIPAGDDWHKIIGGWNTADLRGDLLEIIRTGDRIAIHDWLVAKNINHDILEKEVY